MKAEFSCRMLLVAAVAVCGCGRPSLRPLAPEAVVVAFGDSLTEGVGAAEEESYPAVLATLLGRTVINAGVPGEVSEEGAERLPQVLRKHHPDLVVICHGGNDFLRRAEDAQVERNVQAMVEAAQAAGADVILLGVPRPGLFLKVSPVYEAVARRQGVPCEKKALPKILGSPSLKSDAIHPNADGYRKLAEAVAALIREKQK